PRVISLSFNCDTSPPLFSISPSVGRSSPPIRFSSVDLPEPEGPTIDTISPRATSRSRRWSAVTLRLPSNCLETPRRRITCFHDARAPLFLQRLCTIGNKPSMRIGVDAGGTFTDFIVLHDDGRIQTFKLRSNPRAPAQVILDGLARAAGRRKAEVVHGSTVATNALLERKGARTAFITTAGFEDLLEIRRQNRAELYNLTPAPKRVLVDRSLCFGVRERAHHDGKIALRPTSA